MLTKSKFLRGRQCSRRLWLAEHGVEEPAVESEETWDEREIEGAAVESIAEQLFESPVRVGDPDADDDRAAVAATFAACVARTQAATDSRRVVVQAYLQRDGLLAITDILAPTPAGWVVWEVKASTSERPIHDWDLAFQWIVAERCGLDVAGAGLLLLDAAYTRGDGDISPHQLIRRLDRAAEVRALLDRTRTEIEEQQRVIARTAIPDERPSARCRGNPDARDGNRPSECGHLSSEGSCGRSLPKNWAGRLPRLAGKKAAVVYALPDQSIERLDPNDTKLEWTDPQRRCIEAVQTGRPVVDRDSLRRELDRLTWPVAYVDFEFDPGMAIPRFAGCRPYDKLPFQWSMLVQDKAGGELAERSPFLHLEATDPRRSFAEAFLAALPSSGSIVAHHAPAETTVLEQLAARLGEPIASRLRALTDRFFDTETLSRAGYCHADQRGSWSIKKLAPALLGAGYEDLAIQDGMAAVTAWRQACRETDAATREGAQRDLLHYCGRDTRLMHDIVERLRTLAARNA